MFCFECGKEIDDSSQFCPFCGSPIPTAVDGVYTNQAVNEGWGNPTPQPPATAMQPQATGVAQVPVGSNRPKGNNALKVAAAICAVSLIGLGAVIVPRILDNKTVEEDEAQVTTTVAKDETTKEEVDTPHTESVAVVADEPETLTLAVSSIDISNYPEVKVEFTAKGEDGSAYSDIKRADVSVKESDGSGSEHAGAVSSLEDKGGGSYVVTYTSGSGAAANEKISLSVACSRSREFEGSADGSYKLPEPEPEPEPEPQVIYIEKEPDPTPSPSVTTGYILPESNTRYYSASELSWMSKDQLELARNEIYARHGRGFNTDYIQAYFNNCSWYTRLYSPEEFDAMLANNPGIFNDYEYANVDLLWNLE